MQPLPGCLDPVLEAMALPAPGFDQHDPGGLYEQGAQVAIAALGYLAQDGAVPGGDLPGNESQPGGKVAALGEHIPGTDRCHHRTGDDWPDAGHAHQPLAASILACESVDLTR